MAKPGMMLYWEMFDTLDRAKGEKVKTLLSAMRNFSQYGEIPDFNGDEALDLVWGILQQRIESDNANYEKIVQQRKDAVNSRWEKERAKKNLAQEAIRTNTTEYESIRKIPTTTTAMLVIRPCPLSVPMNTSARLKNLKCM